MREILFRGKRKDTSEWTEGLTVFKLDKYVYMCKSSMCEITYDLQYNIKAITSKNPFFVEVIPETVGQYTGLTDKNGRKIFESDILKTRTYGKISDNIIVNGFDTFAVIYKPCMFRLVNRNRRFNFVNIRRDQLEVIGNVHDNPEMLGGDENEAD